MKRFLFNIYRIVVPKPVRTIITRHNLRKKILDYFSRISPDMISAEQNEVIEFLKSNRLEIFPYPFSSSYRPEDITVFYDPGNGMHYVILNGKRLYFKRRWSKKRIRKGFSDLLREQDEHSPHRYLTDDFNVKPDDVVADIGAAEGNFSLSVVDRVKKIYIFEYNPGWVQALRATFEPWKDKVEIISKRVADFDDDIHIRFDTFLKGREDITFLKIDVDGAEQSVLNSSREIIMGRKPVRIALCTYHRTDDEKDFTQQLQERGFTVTPSGGYMVHLYDKKIKAPYLRRGLIRCVRL